VQIANIKAHFDCWLKRARRGYRRGFCDHDFGCLISADLGWVPAATRRAAFYNVALRGSRTKFTCKIMQMLHTSLC
jgi:hypothetical protein